MPIPFTRRRFLQAVTATALVGPWLTASAQAAGQISKKIPSSGETVPAIGLGSSRTFNVGDDRGLRDNCAEVIRHFLDAGGTLIDSSPMYGTSQDVIGYSLDKLGRADAVFAADKVWASDSDEGPDQMQNSVELWRVPRIDLMQVHNLVSWQEHLETLDEMKRRGAIRYVGITTSHGRRHQEFEQVMHGRPLDFVQLTYNIVDRQAEQRLLPLARDKGIAVIVNRPFRRGRLIDRLEHQPLPPWASDIGIGNWPQFLLKYIVSHPAVTVVIPATTQVAHVRENMGAGLGELPDAALRKRMADYVTQL